MRNLRVFSYFVYGDAGGGEIYTEHIALPSGERIFNKFLKFLFNCTTFSSNISTVKLNDGVSFSLNLLRRECATQR